MFRDGAPGLPCRGYPHEQTALGEMGPTTLLLPRLPMTDAPLSAQGDNALTGRGTLDQGRHHRAISLGQGSGKFLVPPENTSQQQGPFLTAAGKS